MAILLPLVLGVFFGFALNKAGLTKYNKIVNQFRLSDMAVLKFMMTALVVAGIGLIILHGLGWVNFPVVPATYVAGNLAGGLIFGVGMSLAGFCPGTCVAGAGEGKVDYLFPGILGFFVGALIYGLTYQFVFPKISAIANYGNVTIPQLWNINPYLAITVFSIMALVLFYLIDRMGLSRKQKDL